MSRWVIAAALVGLMTGWSAAYSVQQDSPSPSPYGLPPPFTPKPETTADKTETTADKKSETPADKKAETAIQKAEMPPEEDKSDMPQVYSFNPVQSNKDVQIGDQYFKKGNYTAAAGRYDEATKWNDGNAEAWMRLGEAQEKKSNGKAAREAYQKYLELSPDAKNAAEIKKRLAKLKQS